MNDPSPAHDAHQRAGACALGLTAIAISKTTARSKPGQLAGKASLRPPAWKTSCGAAITDHAIALRNALDPSITITRRWRPPRSRTASSAGWAGSSAISPLAASISWTYAPPSSVSCTPTASIWSISRRRVACCVFVWRATVSWCGETHRPMNGFVSRRHRTGARWSRFCVRPTMPCSSGCGAGRRPRGLGGAGRGGRAASGPRCATLAGTPRRPRSRKRRLRCGAPPRLAGGPSPACHRHAHRVPCRILR